MWGYDAHTQNLAYGPQPPSLQHPFGTDFYGRDLLVRVLTGARVSLSVGVLAALVAASIGTIYGAVSSYNGGLVDSFMMRIVDILYALPYMFSCDYSCHNFSAKACSFFSLLLGLSVGC